MSNNFKFTDVLNPKQNEDSISSFKRVTLDKLIENEENSYPLSDIEQLADSIESLGLLQPLLVKKNASKKYTIIAGHRRYNAIKKLIKDNRLDEDYLVTVKEIEPNEDELITRFKLHETNLQTRSLLKLPEEEKLLIVEDYMELLNLARNQNLLINGKEIKGKTRELVAERFNISLGTAGTLISDVKNKNTPKKEVVKKTIFEQFCKKLEKFAENITQEDMQYIDDIIDMLESLK